MIRVNHLGISKMLRALITLEEKKTDRIRESFKKKRIELSPAG